MNQRLADHLWEQDRINHGYTLPPRAPWPLRLPIIRHVRFLYLLFMAQRQASGYASVGIGTGDLPPYDRWALYAIARGYC